jgi:hypothetical protein
MEPQNIKTLNITCNFLYCNHQLHRALLITLYKVEAVQFTAVRCNVLFVARTVCPLLSEAPCFRIASDVTILGWTLRAAQTSGFLGGVPQDVVLSRALLFWIH